MITYSDRFDSLIQYWANKLNPNGQLNIPLFWKLVKAIVRQESAFMPDAKSLVGAMGLMQVMPGTFLDTRQSLSTKGILVNVNPYDVDANLACGIAYFCDQYEHFPEIPEVHERIRFALASYNAGRGNINKAIKRCRAEGLNFEIWGNVVGWLHGITGEHARETIVYVDKIMYSYLERS